MRSNEKADGVACEVFDSPYKHFVLGQAIDEARAEIGLMWLRSTSAWRLHREDFFSQYELSVWATAGPEVIEASGMLQATQQGADCIRRVYNVVVGECVSLTAHKLEGGQSIGIHTDLPVRGRENFRLVCTFGAAELVGGQLLLFSGPSKTDLAAVYNPVSGGAVGIPLGAKTYHAVNAVSRGSRYSVVIGYKTYALDILPRDGKFGEDELRTLLDALIGAGAEQAKVGSVTQLDHVYEVFRILCGWGADTSSCISGLLYLTDAVELGCKSISDMADMGVNNLLLRRLEDVASTNSSALEDANESTLLIALAIAVERRTDAGWEQYGRRIAELRDLSHAHGRETIVIA